MLTTQAAQQEDQAWAQEGKKLEGRIPKGTSRPFSPPHREIKTTRLAGGLLFGYNPRKAGARLKTPAFTLFRPYCP